MITGIGEFLTSASWSPSPSSTFSVLASPMAHVGAPVASQPGPLCGVPISSTTYFLAIVNEEPFPVTSTSLSSSSGSGRTTIWSPSREMTTASARGAKAKVARRAMTSGTSGARRGIW